MPSPAQATSSKTELKMRTLLLAQLLLKEVGRGIIPFKCWFIHYKFNISIIVYFLKDSFQVSIAHANSERHQLKLRTLLLAQLLLKEIEQTK